LPGQQNVGLNLLGRQQQGVVRRGRFDIANQVLPVQGSQQISHQRFAVGH